MVNFKLVLLFVSKKDFKILLIVNFIPEDILTVVSPGKNVKYVIPRSYPRYSWHIPILSISISYAKKIEPSPFFRLLVWTQIKTPQALARFTFLIGLVILVLTAISHAVALRHPDVRLTSKKKGHRLSLLTIGHLFFHYFCLTHEISPLFLKQHIPPPALRSFSWLNTPSKRRIQK